MKKPPLPKPRYKSNDLFRKGRNWEMNACVGTNGGPYNYDAFSQGFFEAANHIVDSLRKGTSLLPIDLCIYPVVSNYRQGLELGIKHAIIEAQLALDVKEPFKMVHDLKKIWGDFEKLEKQFTPSLMSKEQRKFMSTIIVDFTTTDPIGMVFRYPEDRERKRLIDSFELINLDVLQEAMKQCQAILEQIGFNLDYLNESG